MFGTYAKVDLVPGVAEVIATAMGGLASSNVEGPGLTQEDCVQLVSRWAWYRDRMMRGSAGNIKVALYYNGAFQRVWEGPIANLQKLLADGKCTARLITGDGPLVSPIPGGPGLGDDWAVQLAKAIDCTTTRIKKAKQGGDIPIGLASFTKPIVAPAVVAIIVGGAAVAVIGSVAVWRYFDPDLRKHVATVQGAVAAYDARVAVGKATGTMPPPSPLELGAKKAVEDAASTETTSSLLWGLGIAGGLTAGAVGLAALTK